MSETARGRDAFGSADRSSVLVAAVLGAAAGALGFPVTAALQFDRLPVLFLVGIALGIGLGVAARMTGGRSVVVLLAALIWVLTSSALTLAFATNADLHQIIAVTSNVAPPDTRLASSVCLGLLSGALAASSLIVAGFVTRPTTNGDPGSVAA
jgi:hypothetical protein